MPWGLPRWEWSTGRCVGGQRRRGAPLWHPPRYGHDGGEQPESSPGAEPQPHTLRARARAPSKSWLKKLGLRRQEIFLQENKSLIWIQVEKCLKHAANRQVPGPCSGAAVLAFRHQGVANRNVTSLRCTRGSYEGPRGQGSPTASGTPCTAPLLITVLLVSPAVESVKIWEMVSKQHRAGGYWHVVERVMHPWPWVPGWLSQQGLAEPRPGKRGGQCPLPALPLEQEGAPRSLPRSPLLLPLHSRKPPASKSAAALQFPPQQQAGQGGPASPSCQGATPQPRVPPFPQGKGFPAAHP